MKQQVQDLPCSFTEAGRSRLFLGLDTLNSKLNWWKCIYLNVFVYLCDSGLMRTATLRWLMVLGVVKNCKRDWLVLLVCLKDLDAASWRRDARRRGACTVLILSTLSEANYRMLALQKVQFWRQKINILTVCRVLSQSHGPRSYYSRCLWE